MFGEIASAFGFLKYLFVRERVSVVVPCFNEEKTVGNVIKACFRSPLVAEVIVVDDGSADASARRALAAGARVIRHKKNRGKGAAILSGARAAKSSVLVFIDADFLDLKYGVVDALALPILRGKAGLCKATFQRKEGKVTELTAKPLLCSLFPETKLAQPLSGQFAIRKDLLKKLEISPGWGIDISIVLDSVRLGEKVLEVDIGKLEHKHRSLPELARTSHEVTKTILQKAGFLAKRHRLIIFDFDKTLITQSSISVIAREFGFEKELAAMRVKYSRGELSERQLTRKIAALLAHRPVAQLERISSKLKKRRFAEETLVYLKRMGYKLVIVSFAFRQTVTSCFSQHLFDLIISPVLEEGGNSFTGRVSIPPYPSEQHVFCKGSAARAAMRRLGCKKGETIAVGDSAADLEMFRQAGLGVTLARRLAKKPVLKISSLPELLIIAE